MAEYLIQDSTLTGIADKIRVLSGAEGAMTPAEMQNSLSLASTTVDTQTTLISDIKFALGIGELNVATFYVDNYTYTIPYEMTWAEYLNTYYDDSNVARIWIEENDQLMFDDCCIIHNGQYVYSSHYIVPNCTYDLQIVFYINNERYTALKGTCWGDFYGFNDEEIDGIFFDESRAAYCMIGEEICMLYCDSLDGEFVYDIDNIINGAEYYISFNDTDYE